MPWFARSSKTSIRPSGRRRPKRFVFPPMEQVLGSAPACFRAAFHAGSVALALSARTSPVRGAALASGASPVWGVISVDFPRVPLASTAGVVTRSLVVRSDSALAFAFLFDCFDSQEAETRSPTQD